MLDGAPPEQVARFRELLLAMSYADPEVRPLLDLEGLEAVGARPVKATRSSRAAVDRFGTIDAFVERVEGAMQRTTSDARRSPRAGTCWSSAHCVGGAR